MKNKLQDVELLLSRKDVILSEELISLYDLKKMVSLKIKEFDLNGRLELIRSSYEAVRYPRRLGCISSIELSGFKYGGRQAASMDVIFGEEVDKLSIDYDLTSGDLMYWDNASNEKYSFFLKEHFNNEIYRVILDTMGYCQYFDVDYDNSVEVESVDDDMKCSFIKGVLGESDIEYAFYHNKDDEVFALYRLYDSDVKTDKLFFKKVDAIMKREPILVSGLSSGLQKTIGKKLS